MLSGRALEKLRARDRSLRSCLSYVRDCFEESFENIKASRDLVRSIALFFVLLQLFLFLLLSMAYIHRNPSGFFVLVVVSSLSSLFLLFWIVLHVSLMGATRGEVGRSLSLPNQFTIARFLLVFPILVLILQNLLWAALIVYTACAVTDVFDGLLARARREETRFGVVMDPLADVFSTAAVFTLFLAKGVIPGWLFAILVLRYASLIGGSAFLFFLVGPMRFQATAVGKIVGVLQAIAVIMILILIGDEAMLERVGRYLFPLLGVIFGAVIFSQIRLGWQRIKKGAVPIGSEREPAGF